jgi:imidazolonepropionase
MKPKTKIPVIILEKITCFETIPMRRLFINIKAIAVRDVKAEKPLRAGTLKELPVLNNAWLFCENGRIAGYGAGTEYSSFNADEIIDCQGKFILPSFVDSHTHIVFASTREAEFEDRINWLSYEEIAQRGGGILNSAKMLQLKSEDELFEDAYQRACRQIKQGTGAMEIKSGYGLTVYDELKMLRVIARLKQKLPIPVKATFLGAHAYPREFRNDHEAYIKLIIDEMIPNIAAENLADYIDVFCDKGFFSIDETSRILEAGGKFGLKPKIHGNELGITGGVQVAVRHKAISVDHLEETGEEEIQLLAKADTIATVLPGPSFFLGIPYAPARKLVDSGAALCIATDFNPGSSPNGRMSFMVSLACIKMKLLPAEAINASTINGAFAIELQDEVGSISLGKRANFIITRPVNSIAVLPYMFGEDIIESVYINGEMYK